MMNLARTAKEGPANVATAIAAASSAVNSARLTSVGRRRGMARPYRAQAMHRRYRATQSGGDPMQAADFTLLDQAGREWVLSEHLDTARMLVFLRGDW
jgi:stage V sporulation protein SpoVS